MPGYPPDDPSAPSDPPLVRADDTTLDLRGAASAERVATDATFRGGESFGPYRIERLLGRGGMGEVYEAEQLDTGHRVALKLLSPDLLPSETQRRRFLREGRLAAAVRHPHSLYVYGTEEIGGRPVIAMELARRGTLRDLVEREGALPPAQVARFGVQLAAGLAAAGEAGVLHRDIKPANCFLDEEGKVKIGDYGLSLPSKPEGEGDLTTTGDFLGTPAFASPEQVRGEPLDLRSDLYSLGATLYHLATGRPPFSGTRGARLVAEVLQSRPESPRALRPAIPKALDRILLRCLEKDPARRYQTYAELEQALNELAIEPSAPLSLWPRVAAGLVDSLLLTLFFALVSSDSLTRPMTMALEVQASAMSLLCTLAYGFLCEASWGRTPGKALLGLRVVTASPGAGRVARVLRRNLWFAGGDLLGLAVALPLLLPGALFDQDLVRLAREVPGLLWFFFLFRSARASNGWTARHDSWSGTRVVQAQRRADKTSAPPLAVPESALEARSQLGPYVVASPLAPSGNAVVEGYDRALRRRVWIVPCSAQTPHVALRRRDLDHVGRPRWVHGRRSAEESWDAYELEPGEPFLHAIASPRSWTEVRRWLLDLGETLAQSAAEPALLTPISFDRLWATHRGRLLLLDFVPPELDSTAVQARSAGASLSATTGFLADVALRALGKTRDAEAKSKAGVRTPGALPLHATHLLRRLREGNFDSQEEIVESLVQVQGRRVAPSRPVRLAQAVLGLSLPLFAGVTIAAGEWLSATRHPEQIEVNRALQLRRQLLNEPWSPRMEKDVGMVQLYLAGPLRVAAGDSSASREMAFRMGRSDRDRAELETSLRGYPTPDPDSLRAAIAAYPRLVRRVLPLTARIAPLAIARDGLLGVGVAACLGVLFGFFLALPFRGGLSYRLLGLILVDARGEEITLSRVLLRWLVGAIPFGIMSWLGLTRFHRDAQGRNDFFTSTWMVLAGLLCLLAILWAVVDRRRIFQDYICGTQVTVE